jgi:CelD/BcsL family acetyltransferase involved in cellulose biosynthesis
LVVLVVAGQVWEREGVPLKFQLGDLVLGCAVLSLFRRSAQLDESPLDIGDTPEPPPRLDDADGYVVWSQPIVKSWPALTARRHAVFYTPRQYRRFSIDLSGNFDRYMSALSRKSRSGLKRKLRKFGDASGGAIDWREYRTPSEIELFFPMARKISAKTYQERLLHAGLPADQRFITSMLNLSKTNSVRAFLLFLNGEPISYLYCPVRQGVIIYDHLGYDPAYFSLSPGTVLQLLALEALFAEQCFLMFDFTEGEGQHKEVFATQSVFCGDLFVINRRLTPLSAVMLHWSVDKTSRAVGAMLDRLRLKSRVRHLLRHV